MKIFFTKEGVPLLNLSFDEEHDLAEVVIELIASRWVDDETHRFLDDIYERKSKGLRISPDDFDTLSEYVAKQFLEYSLGIEDGVIEDKPVYTRRRDILQGMFVTLDEMRSGTDAMHYDGTNALELRTSVVRAWEEVRRQHEGIKKVSDKYTMPMGRDLLDTFERPSLEQIQEFIQEQDKKFYDRVDEIMSWDERPSRRDAIIYARDEFGGTGEDLARVEFPWAFKSKPTDPEDIEGE